VSLPMSVNEVHDFSNFGQRTSFKLVFSLDLFDQSSTSKGCTARARSLCHLIVIQNDRLCGKDFHSSRGGAPL
jgi:hypothetical protein